MGRFDFEPLSSLEPVDPHPSGTRLSLQRVDGAEVPSGRLEVWLGPKIVGGRYFRLFITGGGPRVMFVQGLYNAGRYPGENWAEIFDVDPPPVLAGTAEWEHALAAYLRPLADAVPRGGHLMIEYEKDMWRTTQLGLLGGIPPLATPMGALLYAIGAGDSFKDWYFPEGGQEGGRKLQGNKALDDEQAQEMRRQRAEELRAFLEGPVRGDPAIDARARRDATWILAELTS